MSLITPDDFKAKITALTTSRERVLVGIAGPPASGKSTLADQLALDIGPTAKILPMDGFHLDNEELHKRGLFHRKGAPSTFDATGFVDLIRKLAEQENVPFPTFDRVADKTIPNGGQISKDTKVVLVEGNYLLLNTSPWDELADLFDLTVQIDVDRATLEKRLISRWIDHGLTEDQARARAFGNDMKNHDFVKDNSIEPEFRA